MLEKITYSQEFNNLKLKAAEMIWHANDSIELNACSKDSQAKFALDIKLLSDSVDLEDEVVDTVVLHNSDLFKSVPHLVLREAKRVLKPQGKILMTINTATDRKGPLKWLKFFKLSGNVRDLKAIDITLYDLNFILADQRLVIDKNYVIDQNVLSLEIVKLDEF